MQRRDTDREKRQRTSVPLSALKSWQSCKRWMLFSDAGSALPGARCLVQLCLRKIWADELYRERQAAARQAGHHRQRRMPGDVERRARLSGIGAFGLGRIIEPA